jgi:hypothetical protein
MSDDDKLTPETPSRHMQMENEARQLEGSLRETADKLGLTLKVRYDPSHWCFRFFALPKCPPVSHDIDEEAFAYPTKGAGLADLVANVLEILQLQVHDKLAEQMSATNVRQRQFGLTKDDKSTLHDMFMLACERLSSDYSRAGMNGPKIEAFQALMNRLYR